MEKTAKEKFETLFTAITALMPTVDTENEKQMAVYSAMHELKTELSKFRSPVSQQFTREKIQEICERYIQNLQSKHDAFLGIDGEKSRKDFKLGMSWGIDGMKMLEDELLCYTDDIQISCPDAQKEIEELKSALTSKESAVMKAVEAIERTIKYFECGQDLEAHVNYLYATLSSLKSESKG